MATSTPPAPTTVVPGESETTALARQFERFHEFEHYEVKPIDGAAQFVVVPAGKSVQDLAPILDKYLPKPARRRGTSVLTDTVSFIRIVNRFASEHSAIFADPSVEAPKLMAVFDYHPKDGDVSVAAFLEHRAVYAPALSEAWEAWLENDGTLMGQAEFAAFVEEHIGDIIVPNFDDPDLKTFAGLVQGKFAEPSDLMGLARGLSINVDVAIKQAVQLHSGEISLRYDENHKDGEGRPVDIANLFQICIPVFYAGPKYRMAARLRYRVTGQRVQWAYQLVRTDLVFDHAFREILDKVEAETDAPVFLGKPEA